MWRVVQHRFIKDSDQNDRPNVIWTGGRFKEARGQAKSALFSHLEMIEKHDFFPNRDETQIVMRETSFGAWFYDENAMLIYSIRYEVEEDEADS